MRPSTTPDRETARALLSVSDSRWLTGRWGLPVAEDAEELVSHAEVLFELRAAFLGVADVLVELSAKTSPLGVVTGGFERRRRRGVRPSARA